VKGPDPAREVARADELARAGAFREAEEAYRRVLDAPPRAGTTDRALLGLARLAATPENADRDPTQARALLDRLVREYPDSAWAADARAWRSLLDALVAQRRPRSATGARPSGSATTSPACGRT
jgi:tetratricopeptide (TPR) repeat protein